MDKVVVKVGDEVTFLHLVGDKGSKWTGEVRKIFNHFGGHYAVIITPKHKSKFIVNLRDIISVNPSTNNLKLDLNKFM